jgi:nucleotide-binding universal stress UspA family protein
MIKRILIPLDNSPFTDSALELGTYIAKLNKAELTGLVILDIPGIERSIGPIPLGGLYYAEKREKAKRKKAEQRIQELLTRFRAKCDKEGISHQEAEQQGSPSQRIIQESIFYDAVIIGMRTYFNFESEDPEGDSLEDILDETITPVYAVPNKLIFPKTPQERLRVLIAFDGSLPAARAMQRFAQLAPPGVFEVLLLTSDNKKEKAYYLLDQAENYLRCQEFEHIEKKWVTDDIISAINNTYLDWAHIVVVGAHSKRGMFNFMVGSLTKYLIKAARKPVLIGQ